MEKGLSYFVADVHLGLDYNNPKERENKFVSFLASLPQQTTDLYLLGDIFDFWYEYKDVIPHKYTRTLGALASLSDKGVKIHFFNGNHDIWTYKFLQKELGIEVFDKVRMFSINGVNFCLGHGDDLWGNNRGYHLLKSIFKNRFLQTLFSALHPRWAFLLGSKWSKHNRLTHNLKKKEYEALKQKVAVESAEWAEGWKSSSKIANKEDFDRVDHFIFGHYHTPLKEDLKNGADLYILGDWIHHPDYIIFDGEKLQRVELTF